MYILIFSSNLGIFFRYFFTYSLCSIHCSQFCECIYRSGNARSYSMFNFVGNHHTAFYSVCTILHSTCNAQEFLLLQFLINTCFLFVCGCVYDSLLIGVKWYFIVVLICISLVVSDGEHLLVFISYLCIFFGEIAIRVIFPFFILL